MARKGLYVLCVALTIVLINAVPAFASFADVSDQKLSAKVNELAQKNIINGFPDGSYRPSAPLTRAQMAKIITLAKGFSAISASSSMTSFNDVTREHWAAQFIDASSNAGIIKGYPDGTFRPNENITRAELARMLRRSIDAKQINSVKQTFTDVSKTYWAFNEVETVSHFQLMGGYKDGGFHPAEPATRGQIAVAVHKIINTTFSGLDDSAPESIEQTITPQDAESTATAPADDGKVIICIDAGHGGKDPGAVAKSNGLREKDVNLAVALKLRSQLEGKVNEVVMTRSTDEFIELSKRAQIANQANADLFVSIHHNSAPTDTAAGTAVYSFTGSQAGAELAKLIQSELVKAFGWDNVAGKDDGARTANYAVLRQTTMTAALCESAYLSNSGEASLMATDDFRLKEADAIAKAILKYVDKNIK